MDDAAYTQRPFSAADAAFVVACHRFEHAAPFVSAPPSEQHVAASLDSPGVVRRIVLDGSGERAGLWIASVHDAWLVELHLIVAARPGRGAGTYALRCAKQFAFRETGAHRLWLEVAARNAVARKLYEREGFRHEGTYRDGFRNQDGTYEDLAHYGMLEGEDR